MGLLTNEGKDALANQLKDELGEGDKLSIISSYFSVFAFDELKDELSKVDGLRFIFDEPVFTWDAGSATAEPEDELQRERAVGGSGQELTLTNGLDLRAIARECAAWAKRNNVSFASVRHPGGTGVGSLYHIERPDGTAHAFNGMKMSFDLEGLGVKREADAMGSAPYYSFGEGPEAMMAEQLKTRFDAIWNDPKLVQDVTDKVIGQVEALCKDNPPSLIYYLTLYHVFHDFMEDVEADDPLVNAVNFQNSVVWNKLYDFQKDAVVGAIHKLEKYNGCIIADSVGLGKTFEALAVIKYYQEKREGSVLVLTPKRLRENWTLYANESDDRNPLRQDQLHYTVLNHTDLSRDSGKSGDVDLEHVDWGSFGLLVIDESHNFRNKPTHKTDKNRYYCLMDKVIKSGRRTKVLMLSATPVNNKILDLRNQIEIISEGKDDYLAQTDDIPSITAVTRVAQRCFKDWGELPDGQRTTQQFIKMMNPEYFKLLDIFTIARSRKHVEKYYSDKGAKFPRRNKPISLQPSIDKEGKLPSIAELNELIASLKFPQYQLLAPEYLPASKRDKYEKRYEQSWGNSYKSQLDRTRAVANLMRVNMLKRMESSANSFDATLERIFQGVDELIKKLDDLKDSPSAFSYSTAGAEDQFDDDYDAAEFEAGGNLKVDLRDVDRIRLRQDLESDWEVLDKLIGYMRCISTSRDAKLSELKDFLAKKAACPYNPGNRKVLVFSAFADTASYLYESLSGYLKERYGMESGLVTGAKGTKTTLDLKRCDFEAILSHFSPKSKELSEEHVRAEGEIDVLFATDCISEGQNLQDCDCVVNYDIHWNPVRIIQRFGRIDRLGSTNECIQLVNFWPDIELDEYINLENRVKGRMVLLDVSATGEENVLDPKAQDEMNDLRYRKQQLEELKEEALDFEDVSGGISITDFTFDDFRVELQRYVQHNPGKLESAMEGLVGVALIPEEHRADYAPGAIFCIRANGADEDKKDEDAIWPYYLVYVTDTGEIRGSITQPKATLDLVSLCAQGQRKPDKELYAAFNRETINGKQMDAYKKLLRVAVESISGEQEEQGVNALFAPGEIGTGEPLAFDDYSLVSMLVLR